MALISFDNVSLAYDGVLVVTDLTFEVCEGDYLCVVGENGSGKSTLMKAVLGLIKANSGKITFGDGLKQNGIGYLPQQTDIQRDLPASVFEVVLSGTLNRGRIFPTYSKEEKQIALKNIELMGISHLKNSCYNTLSGGLQQRVLLARALCASSKLLVLDEPVTGLDPAGTKELYGIIKRLNVEQGITVMMVSHDIRAIDREATKILHLQHKPIFFGDTEDYFKQDYISGSKGCKPELQ